VSQEGLDLLGDHYQAKSSDQVEYRRFVLDVNRVFVEPDLEQAPARVTTTVADHMRESEHHLEADLEVLYGSIVEVSDTKAHTVNRDHDAFLKRLLSRP